MRRVLVTGAAGFFGSHMIREILETTDWEIIALCRLSNIGDMKRLTTDFMQTHAIDRVKFVYHDLKFDLSQHLIETIGKVDYIIHLAANSHVDRSITHPKQFFEDNA